MSDPLSEEKIPNNIFFDTEDNNNNSNINNNFSKNLSENY